MRAPTLTPTWARRAAWLGMAAMLALVLAIAALPAEASRLAHACVALAGWSLAHWTCPQPVESSLFMTHGLSPGLVPAS